MKPPKHNFRIYVNLNKKGFFSIQAKVNGRWKVITYAKHLIAYNAFYKVYETGRQKVLRKRKRNVHAYLMCNEFKIIQEPSNLENLLRIRYNPYLHKQFKIGYPAPLIKSKEIIFQDIFFAKEIIASNSKTYLYLPLTDFQTFSNKQTKILQKTLF